MGDLAGKLTGTVLVQDERDGTPDVIEEAWFGFRFTIETDAESVARHEAELKELGDRRNQLVHHFLPRWQAAVGGDADAALAWLDEQRGAAVGMLDRLQGWARTVETARKEHAAFLASEEGARQMELLVLRSSRLVVMLGRWQRRARTAGRCSRQRRTWYAGTRLQNYWTCERASGMQPLRP
jgi:hypothetical protein